MCGPDNIYQPPLRTICRNSKAYNEKAPDFSEANVGADLDEISGEPPTLPM